MSSTPSRPHRDIIPRQTSSPPSSKRRRVVAPRQVIPDLVQIAQAETDCELLSGNNVISCFPTAGISIPQDEWATLVCKSS